MSLRTLDEPRLAPRQFINLFVPAELDLIYRRHWCGSLGGETQAAKAASEAGNVATVEKVTVKITANPLKNGKMGPDQ